LREPGKADLTLDAIESLIDLEKLRGNRGASIGVDQRGDAG